MKIAIIVGGKFHAFNLAQQLESANCLSQIITSYPSSSLKEYGIFKPKINSIIIKEILMNFLVNFLLLKHFLTMRIFYVRCLLKKPQNLLI